MRESGDGGERGVGALTVVQLTREGVGGRGEEEMKGGEGREK